MSEISAGDQTTRKKSRKKSRRKAPKTPHPDTTLAMGGVSMSKVNEFYGETSWSWLHWVPEGMLTMFAGPQGTGKSHLMAHLIAVFTGAVAHWPDGTLYTGPTGIVILIETEHMRGEYISRMKMLGIEDEFVKFPAPIEEDPTYVIDLAHDMDDLGKYAHEVGAVAIIVDSLSGGHTLDESNNTMRVVLKNLATVAGSLQVPMILVHHTRKKSLNEPEKVTVDRVRGSSTITQFCRSVVGMYRLTDDQVSPVRVEVIKASLCRPPKPFGFTIEVNGLDFTDAPKFEKKLTKVEVAREFLKVELADGVEADSALLRVKAATEQGISKNKLYEAADDLGIVKVKNTPWKLPTIEEDGSTQEDKRGM